MTNLAKNQNKIIWHLLIMLALMLFLDPTVSFVLSFFYLVYILYKQEGIVYKINIPGLTTYVLLIVVNVFIGLIVDNSLRNILRDMYYFFPTIIWIIIGVNLVQSKSISFKSFYKTICLFGVLCSITAFIKFITTGDFSFNGLRNNFVTGIYNVDFIWLLMIYNFIFDKNYAFSKKTDSLFIAVMGVHIALSLGRISMLLPLAGMIVLFALYFGVKRNYSALKKMFLLIFIFAFLIIIAYLIIPDEVKVYFFQKIFNTFSEVDTNQTINSTEMAMNHWRAYENQVCLQQYKSQNLLQQIFGSGLGTSVKVAYVPYNWEGMLEDNNIPLLHNGFLTALIKIGIVGTIAMALMFLVPLYKGMKNIRLTNDKLSIMARIMIVTYSFMAIISTYVVRGPIQQGAFLLWALLIGPLTKWSEK